MIATKTLLLMVMGLAGRENGGKAKNCAVLGPGARFSKVPETLRARNQMFKSKYKE